MENKKSVLDEILSHYERDENSETQVQSEWKESDYALWNYLCGDGDIVHLHEHYDLVSQGK